MILPSPGKKSADAHGQNQCLITFYKTVPRLRVQSQLKKRDNLNGFVDQKYFFLGLSINDVTALEERALG